VGRGERARNVGGDVQSPRGRQGAALFDNFAELAAVEQLHDHEIRAALGILGEVGDVDDPLVPDLACGKAFALKPREQLGRARDVRREHLERHALLQA
jgi:hypothetical protein